MFISDETLEKLPAPAQIGKTKVGGIDFNKARMRHVTQAILALSAWPGGFTASQLAARVRDCGETDYQSRPAAYDLKKLRGKEMVRRISNTRKYEPTCTGLKAMTALLVLREKVIKPLRAASIETKPAPWSPESKQPRPPLRDHPCGHAGRFSGTGFRCLNIDNSFFGLRPQVPSAERAPH